MVQWGECYNGQGAAGSIGASYSLVIVDIQRRRSRSLRGSNTEVRVSDPVTLPSFLLLVHLSPLKYVLCHAGLTRQLLVQIVADAAVDDLPTIINVALTCRHLYGVIAVCAP